MGYYDITVPRRLELSHPNVHHKGLVHPRRIMQIHDFLYITEGEWEIFLGEKPYLLEKDDMIILHAGVEHYGNKPCLPETKVYFLHVFPEERDSFREISETPPHGCVKIANVVHCRGNLEIKKLFKEIISTFWNGTPQSVSKNSVLLHMLLLRASEAENAGSGSEADITERCINIINSHPERFVSPEEMARALFVSERTLRNAFKRSHNTTPYNYQRDLKLKRAIALMREYPEMTMREIALNLGFADDSHFSKVFKSVYGVSPANYKNSLAEKDEVPGISFMPISENDIVRQC